MPGLHDIQEEASLDAVRRKYLRELAAHTRRDTVLYAAGLGLKPAALMPPGPLMISPEDVQGFMTSLHGLHGDSLDLILHSQGGSSEGAEQIVLYLRSKYKHIRVIVPQNAMSAATMIACAADEILMGRESALGPIDPQIAIGPGPSVPAQSILDDFDEAKRLVAADPRLAALLVPKFLSLPHGMLSYCKRAIDRAKVLVGEWLERYMKLDHATAMAAADWLASHEDHKSHGRPINAERAIEHHINVQMLEADNTLQDKVLSVYHAMMLTLNGTACVKMIESHHKKGQYTQVQIQVPPMIGGPMPAPVVAPRPEPPPAATPAPASHPLKPTSSE